MSTPIHVEVDGEIREACETEDSDRATTLALRTYGRDILGWLVERLRSETAGSDAFSIFTEDLWHSWDTFGWRCSVRGWCFVIARNAGNRIANKSATERKRKVALSSSIGLVADEVRTTTLPHLRTTMKDRFRELREGLSSEEQTILSLRVDKKTLLGRRRPHCP